ncbi:MAG: MerR family transcriptional regulator [Candidatus Omnitrophica bacterium]|nr:MerR family transcriptional regulator [Candidatus Omnitrophota bacterium]
MDHIYLLKDLAQGTGYSTHTLKYYMQLGLFEETGRSPLTNFRYFDNGTIEKLKEIRRLQGDGLSLKEIKEKINP